MHAMGAQADALKFVAALIHVNASCVASLAAAFLIAPGVDRRFAGCMNGL
jgi:hypothetical protein